MAYENDSTLTPAQNEDRRKRAEAADVYAANEANRPKNPYSGSGQPLDARSQLSYLQNQNAFQTGQDHTGYVAGYMSGDQYDRQSDRNLGRRAGIDLFYNDPDQMALRDRRIDLSKGYNGAELGAYRQSARDALQGQRNAYLQQLNSRTAKAGVGGARAAAIQGAADQGFQKTNAANENKMALDNANLTRQGTNDLQDYLLKQKYGVLASELGEAGLGAGDRGAVLQANAANGGSSGMSWVCTEVHKNEKFRLSEWKALTKLKKYGLKEDTEHCQKYLKEAHNLIHKMNESHFDWLRLKPELINVIKMVESGKLEMAYGKYKHMMFTLISKYWKECVL